MYFFIVSIIFAILFIVVCKCKNEIKRQKNINFKLKKDNNILASIEKFQIEYLKNGYNIPKYKGKILLGDYDLFSVSNTVGVLRKLGYDFDIVNCAEDILFKVKSNKYDYIITNYLYMHGIDGIKLCEIIKNDFKLSTPIIILSSSNYLQDEFRKVADYYIEKPLTKSKLEKFID